MKYLPVLVLLFGACLLSCADKPCCSDGEYGVFYASPLGTGQYDQMTYLHYWSEVNLKSGVEVKLMSITPKVFLCGGDCYFEIYLMNSDGDTMSRAVSIQEGTDLEAYFEPNIKLDPDSWYMLNMHIWSTKSVGIYTSGLTPDDRLDDFEVISARSDTWDDHYVRGSVAFKLLGKYR
ncbi:MAG: hypothetical protein JSV52_00820 [Candidatus Zixiibacteriota bacterium]|nr:MAG: hypothetical protein JSV52_00820 [candidate division Zixibacteria bacterium]